MIPLLLVVNFVTFATLIKGKQVYGQENAYKNMFQANLNSN